MISSNQDIDVLQRLLTKPGNRPHVISFCGKGGAGKTTATIQIGAIAKAAGHSVMILDADRQVSMTSWTFARGAGDVHVRACRPEQVVEHISRSGLSGIDIVLVDNAPGENACSEKIAQVADLTIIMTKASLFDLRVAETWLKLLGRLGALSGVVINEAPPRRAGAEAPMVREAREALGKATPRVWGGQITRRHSVIDCTGQGRAVVEMDADGPAAVEFKALWNAVVKLIERAGS